MRAQIPNNHCLFILTVLLAKSWGLSNKVRASLDRVSLGHKKPFQLYPRSCSYTNSFLYFLSSELHLLIAVSFHERSLGACAAITDRKCKEGKKSSRWQKKEWLCCDPKFQFIALQFHLAAQTTLWICWDGTSASRTSASQLRSASQPHLASKWFELATEYPDNF